MNRPELLIDCRCECGEGPLWDARRQVVHWLDIPKGRLFEYDASTDRRGIVYEGEPIAGFTFQESGGFLLFEVDRISSLDPDGTHRVLIENVDPDMKRFNDVIADPRGRVFAGTIGKEPGKGGLYRIGLDGEIRCLFKDTLIANGMSFSLDLESFFYTDTTARKIFRFDYDIDSGELSNRTVFHEVKRSIELPDGLTIDSEGCLWSARWDGSCIQRLSPVGQEMERVSFPVPQISSLCFGGENLDTLYSTSAGGSESDTSGNGALFRFQPGVSGREEFRSKIDPDSDWRVL